MDSAEGDAQSIVNKPGSDLADDIAVNLNILSDLFPEMAATKPAEAADKNTEASKTGFERMGTLMPRFDPRDESTQKYLIPETELEDDSSESSEQIEKMNDVQDDSDSSSEVNDDEEKEEQEKEEGGAPTKGVDPIYEQGKLEDVFREARDAWQVSSNHVAEQEPSSTGGAFTFGFDLGEASSTEQQTGDSNTGFSFAFNVPDPTAPKETAAKAATSDEVEASESHDMDIVAEEEKKPERRRRGLRFPQEILEKHQSDFFACNDGSRIMHGLEGFRNDAQVKEKWNKERQTLTMDWKRKRKHAQSRIQKRMKLR
jgi:hypothetical protein